MIVHLSSHRHISIYTFTWKNLASDKITSARNAEVQMSNTEVENTRKSCKAVNKLVGPRSLFISSQTSEESPR
jgi:hypothetical protein